MHTKYPNHSGFTLIELLVVIAIIGTLATVVLANLNSARDKASDAAAVASISQLQTALQLYNLDNGDYPSGGGGTNDWYIISNDASCWSAEVFPLVNLTPYISQLPQTPSNGECIWYQPRNSGDGYWIVFVPINSSVISQGNGCYLGSYYCVGMDY